MAYVKAPEVFPVDATAQEKLESPELQRDVSMLPNFIKKAASLFVVLILAVAVLLPCASAAAVDRDQSQKLAVIDFGGDETSGHDDPCPKCPDADHSDNDNCSCSCSCHPPVLPGWLTIYWQPVVIAHASVEPFTVLPEVYIPKFIPPQNLV